MPLIASGIGHHTEPRNALPQHREQLSSSHATQHANLFDGMPCQPRYANAVLRDGLVTVFVRSYCFDEPGVHFVAGRIQIGNQPLGVIASVLTNFLHFVLG